MDARLHLVEIKAHCGFQVFRLQLASLFFAAPDQNPVADDEVLWYLREVLDKIKDDRGKSRANTIHRLTVLSFIRSRM